MKIWIDLANSPHVLFFRPVIEELTRRGHDIIVTHRNFAQTSQLCEVFGIKSMEVGAHGGQGVARKVNNTLGRAFKLRKVAKPLGIDVAVSHNSYAHCIAAKMLGIPYITIMDYEYQPANHINFRLADKILVPFTFRLDEIKKYGATAKKIVKYPGLKEELYLRGFLRDDMFWSKEFPELDASKVMCMLRPPATMAAYHDFANPIFDDLLHYLLVREKVQVIFFPRTAEQGRNFAAAFPQMYIARKSVDGAQLIANSDLVISAGGTMNREAAVLGTPAYTIYAGKMGSVDRHLLAEGKIVRIESKDDFRLVRTEKKKDLGVDVKGDVFLFIVGQIENEGAA